MTRTELVKLVELAQSDFDAALEKANKALKNNDAEGYTTAITALGEAEKDYAQNYAKVWYFDVATEAKAAGKSPIREAILRYSYSVIGHKEVMTEGKNPVVASVEATSKDKQIDLMAFCKVNGIDTPWADTLSKFNQLLCLRTAKSLGYDTKELASVKNAYYLRKACEAINLGGTPTSNNQMCKLLQSITDGILAPTEGEKFTITNPDVAYLDALYCKKSSKAKLTLSVSKDGSLLKILVDTMHRLLTASRYAVDGYKTRKN